MVLGYVLGSILINAGSFTLIFPFIYAIIGAGSAFATAPGYALVVDMFSKQERGWAGMGIALFSAVGTLLGILLEELNFFTFEEFFLIVPILLLVISIIVFILLPKVENKKRSPYSFTRDLKYTPAYLFNLEKYHGSNGATGNDMFIKLLFVQIFMGASVYLIAIDVPLFLVLLKDSEFSFGLEPGFALIILGTFGLAFAGPIGYIIRYIGKTKTAMGGSFIFAISSFLLAQEVMWNYNGFVIILMMIGSSSVIVSIMTVALPADKIPETNAGQFMGIFTVASMLLLPVFTFLTAVLFELVKNEYLGFQILFYSMGIIQLFVITLLYSLDKKEQLIIQKQLVHPDLANPVVE
jgi:MFS family permease